MWWILLVDFVVDVPLTEVSHRIHITSQRIAEFSRNTSEWKGMEWNYFLIYRFVCECVNKGRVVFSSLVQKKTYIQVSLLCILCMSHVKRIQLTCPPVRSYLISTQLTPFNILSFIICYRLYYIIYIYIEV